MSLKLMESCSMSITSSCPCSTHCAMAALRCRHEITARKRQGYYLHNCMQSGNLTCRRELSALALGCKTRFRCDLLQRRHLRPQA